MIDRIHTLTENKVISRKGILGLNFEESFKKYGSCYIEIKLTSVDTVSDGYWTSISICRLQFSHTSVWFAELDGVGGDASNYNKNHFFGYLKLQELGYELPDTPQI